MIGLIKVGFKKLFVSNKNSKLVEINPLCVLDFYVHESQQRSGVGKVHRVNYVGLIRKDALFREY